MSLKEEIYEMLSSAFADEQDIRELKGRLQSLEEQRKAVEFLLQEKEKQIELFGDNVQKKIQTEINPQNAAEQKFTIEAKKILSELERWPTDRGHKRVYFVVRFKKIVSGVPQFVLYIRRLLDSTVDPRFYETASGIRSTNWEPVFKETSKVFGNILSNLTDVVEVIPARNFKPAKEDNFLQTVLKVKLSPKIKVSQGTMDDCLKSVTDLVQRLNGLSKSTAFESENSNFQRAVEDFAFEPELRDA